MSTSDIYLSHNSSSSAVDLTPISPPQSPNPYTARRRASWGRVQVLDAGQDPLRRGTGELEEDNLFENSSRSLSFRPRTETQYEEYGAGESTASLLEMDGNGAREDDEARLTTNTGEDMDVELGGGPGTGSQRRRPTTVRYSTSPSALKQIKTISRNLRRASLRVVNLGNNSLEEKARVRLADEDDDKEQKDDSDSDSLSDLPDLRLRLPIRGRTLGFLGPNSSFRLALYKFLVYPYTEPTILLLIILDAVVLTIQASRSLTLPDGAAVGDALPLPSKGYFIQWEDYVIFALFCVFTLEAIARISVSGFLFDPDIPMSLFFTAPFTSTMTTTATTTSTLSQSTAPHRTGLPRRLTLVEAAGGGVSLSRGTSITERGISFSERLDRFNRNVQRPWALPNSSSNTSSNVDVELDHEKGQSIPRPSLAFPSSDSNIYNTSSRSRSYSNPTLLKSSSFQTPTPKPSRPGSEPLSLPFALFISQSNLKTSRNVPYLRQSWGRIDFLAIIGFWVCFILATLGLEEGASQHIGIFRALSVLRTARLLTITSGTTTIMHSLKTARPLLANVALFVLFAIILFSVIGIQSFKGSLKRTCFVLPINGEQLQQLSGQFCGGFINATAGEGLQVQSYLLQDGSLSDTSAKGYICPLGQVCQESMNPEGNIESFDTIWYAALQIIITASANSWSSLMYNVIDSEYFVSSLFFIICVIVLNFWLINLFVAVITNTFGAIREETRKSAFGAGSVSLLEDEKDKGWISYDRDRNKSLSTNIFRIVYPYTRWIWVLLALASLALQATRTAQVGEVHAQILSYGELGITLAFDVEIIIRMAAVLPDWRSFFWRRRGSNGYGYGGASGVGVAGAGTHPSASGAGGGFASGNGKGYRSPGTGTGFRGDKGGPSVPARSGESPYGHGHGNGNGAGTGTGSGYAYPPYAYSAEAQSDNLPGAVQNILDTILAIASSIIQIPFIKHSQVYPWLSIFQLVRFYRVILVVPRMKPLLLSVFGNMYGLTNMSLFLILVNYLAALITVQLLRGDMSSGTNVNFGQMLNAFLAVYQVFSSENWTDVLYGAGQAELQLGQTVLVVLFITVWLLFANFIILQMFIAVINENFDVAEEQKRSKQASHYWSTHQASVQAGTATWVRKLNPYRWVRPNPVKVKVENLPSNLVLPMQQTLVQEYKSGLGTEGKGANDEATIGTASTARRGVRHYTTKSLSALQKLFGGDERLHDVPLTTLKHTRSETLGALGDEETERQLELLATVNTDTLNSDDLNDALYERRAQKADFIRDHPSYDKTFWLFSQKNPLRRLCQRIVQPAHGERIFGVQTSHIAHPIFQVVIFLAVIGGIVTEIIATPVYRRNYYAQYGRIRGAWFDITEASFGFVLLIEFLIKIIADGFLFTPNAYIRSIWNIIDLIILVGILVNVTTGLIFIGGLSRFTRSLKALRALRLITLFDRMRSSFQSLIISGASRIFDAALLAILYMIPYAVWGLNIFAGKMNQCNDGSVTDAQDCTDEYVNTYVNDAFGYPVPRVWNNPAPSTTFSFDNFGSSLLILFEIVSLEGWIDVMQAAANVVGIDMQPQTNASQWNALFFLIYNLLGGVVVLTLFVSIIIGNFKSRTGTALLTQPQREWIDLQKLFKRQRPSKRPQRRPTWRFRAWCFDRAVRKHGWWSRCMSVLFTIHVILLMTQTYTSTTFPENTRNDCFLAIIVIYLIDVSVRFYGLGWKSFRANGWNLFDIVVAVGSFATTFVARFGDIGFNGQQLQKFFLVLVAFKLVQRTNSLNKLFKTAIASLPSILSLLLLWLILFMFFAILDVEVFGLTKWMSGENRSQNYSSISSALVMLAFMSTGEGWNQYMHDYALVFPRCTNSSGNDSDSDCGSFGWAFTLFIAWNLLSMYIFVNLFTGVVVDSFSYVFQSSGGSKAITREEMRAFKKVWAEFANPQTGYLERSQFVPFFGRLSGVFEIRIYPTQYSILNIKAACKVSPADNSISTLSGYQWPTSASNAVDGLDFDKLNKVLDGIDYAAIRKRRALYSRLYHEAIITHHQGRGLSFTDMLLLLAHHKLIKDSEALVLRDLVIRTETNKLVTDLVNLDRVHSLLKTISYRRRFLAHMEKKRASMYDSDIPAIVVDSMPETPPPLPSPSLPSRPSSRDISSIGFSGWDNSAPNSPTPMRRSNFGSVQLDFGAVGFSGSQQTSPSLPSHDSMLFSHSPDTSLSLAGGAGIGNAGGSSSPRRSVGGAGLQRSSRRTSDMSHISRLSTDLGYRYPRDSMGEDDPNLVLEGMQNSIWGELMEEAMNEEEGHDSGRATKA